MTCLIRFIRQVKLLSLLCLLFQKISHVILNNIVKMPILLNDHYHIKGLKVRAMTGKISASHLVLLHCFSCKNDMRHSTFIFSLNCQFFATLHSKSGTIDTM